MSKNAVLMRDLVNEMLDLVNALRAAQKLTVLFVSHHPDDARAAATQTAFVHEGRILQVGPTDQVFRQLSPELGAYLGEAALETPPPTARAG